MFHLFGEYGHFPHGPDGTSLSHFTSTTGIGEWKLVNPKADGGDKYGVVPYRAIAWKSASISGPYECLGVALIPRSEGKDDWDNHRIQDADIQYIPELQRYIMTCNMMDTDGKPGGKFPTLRKGQSRVVGTFYSNKTMPPEKVENL